MKFKDRIYRNLVAQLLNAIKANELRRKITQIEQENAASIGAMNLLSELYKEDTGRDLQQDINSNPEWAGVMEAAEKEAQRLYGSDTTQTPTTNDAVNKPAPTPIDAEAPKLKRVADNKKIGQPTQEKSAERTREPVKIVIDDTPANYDDDNDAD